MSIVLNGTTGITTPDITAPTTTLSSLNDGQLAGMRNKIINGKMEIAQRGTSFPAIATNTYSLDRWIYNQSGTAVLTASQQSDVPSSNELQSSLRLVITTADTSIASSDYSAINQRIEGYNVRDLIGRTFTLSFWVRSSKTGVHCVSFRNSVPDRCYVVEYTINAANTWEYKTVTVSGGLTTAGTWDWTNGLGLAVWFVLAAGTNFQTTAGAWQTGNFLATSNQVNCLETVGNIFAITGVQLEVGSVATPFEHRPFGAELALCQRYYYRDTSLGAAHIYGPASGGSTTNAVAIVNMPVPMRVAPSSIEQSGTASDYGVSTTVCSAVPTFSSASPTVVTIVLTAAGLTTFNSYTARGRTTSSYLGFSAEL